VFPPYEQIIPSHGNVINVSVAELTVAAEAAHAASDSLLRACRLEFASGSLTVRSTLCVTDAQSEVTIDTIQDEVKAYPACEVIGVSAAYLLDALKVAATFSDRIQIARGAELDPLLLTAGEWSCILMPQRM
jgi:DNA polymerase III sliding clamp (beta) subunit (PCNA family)